MILSPRFLRQLLVLPFLLALVVSGGGGGGPSSAYAQTQQQLRLDRTDSQRNTVGVLSFLGAVVISPGPSKVGGISGLALSADSSGTESGSLIAIADNGRIHRVDPVWTAGRLTGAVFTPGQPLRDLDGSIPKSRARYDSEAITRLPPSFPGGGGWLVAYERDHRIVRFADGGGVPTGVPTLLDLPPGLDTMDRNSGLESLTALPDGRLLALAEQRSEGWLHPAWLWQDGHWSTLNYLSAPGLSPSDVAALPDGGVLVLERGFNFLYGFRNRLVYLPAHTLKPGATLDGQTLATLENPIITENFEGLAVEPMPDGSVRIFIISDNNFIAAQQTILAALSLSPSFKTQGGK